MTLDNLPVKAWYTAVTTILTWSSDAELLSGNFYYATRVNIFSVHADQELKLNLLSLILTFT